MDWNESMKEKTVQNDQFFVIYFLLRNPIFKVMKSIDIMPVTVQSPNASSRVGVCVMWGWEGACARIKERKKERVRERELTNTEHVCWQVRRKNRTWENKVICGRKLVKVKATENVQMWKVEEGESRKRKEFQRLNRRPPRKFKSLILWYLG